MRSRGGWQRDYERKRERQASHPNNRYEPLNRRGSEALMFETQELCINEEENDHVAAVINFDADDGTVIVDGIWLTTGTDKTDTGRYVYFTTDARIFGKPRPTVFWVHKQ
jgi:hypothetical protein